jgi:hypothetical protein
MRLRRCLSAWLLVIACAGAADAADLFTYDTPGEKLGAGMFAPFGRREVVRRTTESCARSFPEMMVEARETLVLWTQRQAGFLAVAATLRDNVATTAEKSGNPQAAAQWRKIVAESMPKQVDTVGRMTDTALDEGVDAGAKRGLCRDFVAKVVSGGADLDQWDPVNAKYLRELAGDDFKEPAAAARAGVRHAPAGGNSRTDATALIGRWKLVRSTGYFLNGTTAENTSASCSLEFAAAKLVSECMPAGQKIRIVFAYRVPSPGRYEVEIVEHETLPKLVGTRSTSSFRVDGEELFVTSYPPTAVNAPERSPLVVEAVSRRDAH